MAEQITPSPDENPQPKHKDDSQASEQSSDPPHGWSPSAGYMTPGMARPEDPAGAQEQTEVAGQPAWPGPAGDFAGHPSGAQPNHSRRLVIIVIAAAAATVLIVGGIGLFALSNRSSGPSYPSTLLGLARDTTPDAEQAAGEMAGKLDVLQGIIVHPGAAIYGSGLNDGLLITTAQWSAATKAAKLVRHTSAGALASVRSQGVTDATSFPPGPLGGGLACGHAAIAGHPTIICAVVDEQMVLVADYVGSASSLSDAAAKTIQVRSAVEH